jgi:alkanesulfonate monooxygenase
MELRIFVEPQQGASYRQQLAVAQTAEMLGFNGFFRSDHYLRMGAGSPLPGPTDSWVTLGAIARETSTIQLGTLVASATFRLPGPLAVAVAQIDDMSNGRIELGLGAGWFDDEHTAYGIPFPTLGQRFDILEEQLEIITGMWNTPLDSQYSFEGTYHGLVGCPAIPKPIQAGGPPIIIGGFGPTRTPRLAAKYASEFNMPFPAVDSFIEQRDRVRSACESIGRDPATMIMSVAQIVCCGSTEGDVIRRAAAIGRATGELRQNGAAGSPAEVLDKLATFAEAGVSRVYLQLMDLDDLDHLHVIAEEVAKLLP